MEVPDELLRPALELTLTAVNAGTKLRPPQSTPTSLRPYLRFQKLPTKALAVVRRAVEEDADLRARVAAITDVVPEELVGRPSWLWLHRPDGWEEELAALVDEGGDAARAKGVDRAMAGRLDRAESRLRQQAAELEVLRSEVVRAQIAREEAEAEAARAKARAEELERAVARLRTRAERSGTELDEAREAAAAGRAEVEALRIELQEAERKLGELDAVGPGPEAAPAHPSLAVDAVEAAAEAATSLAGALRDLIASLPPLPVAAGPAPALDREDAVDDGRDDRATAPRRRALRLPRGLTAGSREADVWLLTGAGAHVVIDGYNVAKLGWPDQPLADQRERLLDVLEDLAVRHQASVQVVFDGAEVGVVRPSGRRHLRVQFSAPGVLADDVIREIVAAQPAGSPVVVVTDDRAVVTDVLTLGANVVASGGLLAVARR